MYKILIFKNTLNASLALEIFNSLFISLLASFLLLYENTVTTPKGT